MKRFYLQRYRMIGILILCLTTASCEKDNEDYPKNYVGFERSNTTLTFDKDKEEAVIQLKIIAAKKENEDRTVVITMPALSTGQVPIAKLTESKLIIKAGKKSVKTTVKVYPKKMILNRQNVQLTCTPQWKEGKSSQLSIQLKKN